jgi:hypothetical protein
MMPYGKNGEWHYTDCKADLNADPECDCVGRMAKQISLLAAECHRLLKIQIIHEKLLRNATHE